MASSFCQKMTLIRPRRAGAFSPNDLMCRRLTATAGLPEYTMNGSVGLEITLPAATTV